MKSIEIGNATLITADVLEGLRSLQENSIQCVVTSPPYWGLRDYGVEEMIGLEPTFDEYLTRMVEVFREVRRVLRPDGTLWLNMGDAYAGGGRGAYCDDGSKQSTNSGSTADASKRDCFKRPDGFKPKDLLMMPARVAIALQADGWWLRSEIIWHKPNPMPESCTDRPTQCHEKIYLLTKSARYFYDADAVREPELVPGASATLNAYQRKSRDGNLRHDPLINDTSGTWKGEGSFTGGRNLRNVWTIPTQSYKEAHFATFPEAIPMKCIMAGTSEKGCCPECGSPWKRVSISTNTPGVDLADKEKKSRGIKTFSSKTPDFTTGRFTTGWEPTCSCDAGDSIPCTVADPFGGSMTTGLVSLKLNRRFTGIEINPEYIQLGIKRIEKEARQCKLFSASS